MLGKLIGVLIDEALKKHFPITIMFIGVLVCFIGIQGQLDIPLFHLEFTDPIEQMSVFLLGVALTLGGMFFQLLTQNNNRESEKSKPYQNDSTNLKSQQTEVKATVNKSAANTTSQRNTVSAQHIINSVQMQSFDSNRVQVIRTLAPYLESQMNEDDLVNPSCDLKKMRVVSCEIHEQWPKVEKVIKPNYERKSSWTTKLYSYTACVRIYSKRLDIRKMSNVK